jgi:hypothetical protein
MITHVVFRAWEGRRASVPGLRRVATDLNTSATAINLARLTILGLRSQPGGWSAEGTRSPASQPDELASVSDELAQLPELRRRDVGLGETSEAQQVDEVLGVPQVVVHPPVTPVVAERVSEVHVCTELPEIIGEPVPAVGGLEDDVGMFPRFEKRLFEGEKISVVDPFGRERVAGVIASHEHRATPVQIDSDILMLQFHIGPPPWWGRFRRPECKFTRNTATGEDLLRLCSLRSCHDTLRRTALGSLSCKDPSRGSEWKLLHLINRTNLEPLIFRCAYR